MHRARGVGVRKSAATWEAMALWAERKADEAAASDKPWALRNLRLYQNKASEYWAEHYKEVRT